MQTELIGSGEAARRLGFSQQYLAQLAKAGGIPFTTDAHGYRIFQVADVELLRAQRATKREPVAA